MSDGAKLSDMACLRERISEPELKNRQLPASKEQERAAKEQAQANEIGLALAADDVCRQARLSVNRLLAKLVLIPIQTLSAPLR